MKKKIIAFGASNSKQSINKRLAKYAASQIPNAAVSVLDLNDYEMPIYSIDREKETGIPPQAHAFKAQLKSADGIVVSFAEHNGSYSTAYKNIYDWVSRIEKSVWHDKPMWLLASSPGGRGAKSVLESATKSISFSNKNTVISFSLPAFHKNFSEENGIQEDALAKVFKQQVETFAEAL